MFTLKRFSFGVVSLIIIASATLSGCAQYATRNTSSQSLAEIVEPVKDSRQMATKASLAFPASVAIAFIPDKNHNIPKTVLREAADALKQQLLANPKYIRSVSVVALEDVKPKISLGQIRSMYDADIAIMLSYEQDQSDQQSGPGGLADATIVGAFLVPSAKTATSTHIDGKIIHIESNALIFRQGGSDRRTTHSTSYGLNGARAQESAKSLLAATHDFGEQLSKTLSKFDNYDLAQAVSMSVVTAEHAATEGGTKDNNWNKVDSFKLGGGGSLDVGSLFFAMACLWLVRVRRKV
jgi:rhombotail lipoprotein